MVEALKAAVRLTLFPSLELGKVAGGSCDSWRLLRQFVLPLACIPALSWCLGLLLFSGDAPPALPLVVRSGAVVYVSTVISIYLLSASICLLARLFLPVRDWQRAFQVAALSAAPVMLSGVLLVVPNLAFATLLAVAHSFYLQYVGTIRVLGIPEGEAAEFVALVSVLFVSWSTLVGALGSALGLL